MAIIDMGSNTFHLLIRGIGADGEGFDLFTKQVHVQMAEGGLKTRRILDDAYYRGIKCLKEFKELIDELNVDHILAFGTSVFRDAINAHEFIQAGSEILEHDIEVVSGEREAQLIWKGVMRAWKPNSKPYAILDIGGGSIELIFGTKQKMHYCQSFPLGGLRLFEAFHHSDPIGRVETNELLNYLKYHLTSARECIEKYKPKTLIGAAGCFQTLSKMEHVNIKSKVFPEYTKSNSIELENFFDLASLIKQSTRAESYEIPGIDNFRVPLMPVSILLIETILGFGNFTDMWHSDYSMKEGIFHEYTAGRLLS